MIKKARTLQITLFEPLHQQPIKVSRFLMLIKKQPYNPSKTAEKSKTLPKSAPAPRTDLEVKKSNPISTTLPRKNKTKITIKYDAGFPNILYLRGEGANLSWDQGIPLRNIRPDEWEWETDASFIFGEFKVLINDEQYEVGENHKLVQGTTVCYTPNF